MGLEKINIMRKSVGMSIDELSEKSGVPKGTVSKITSGITKDPGIKTVKAIVYAMGFKLDDLDNLNNAEASNSNNNNIQLSKNEIEIIQKYRSLDDHGKKNVGMLLENEYQRCKQAKKEFTARELLREIQEKQNSYSYVAAFGGQSDFKELTPEKAAEAIKELERIVKEQK